MAMMMSDPPPRKAKPLTEFEGVTVDASRYAAVAVRLENLTVSLTGLMREVREFRTDATVPEPVRLAMAELNGVIAAAGGMCTKSPPPKAIATVVDGQGRLIYQCAHARQHRWDLDGNPLPPGAP